MYRGLIHFHSCHSYDSVTSIKSIVNFAIKNKINLLVLTDHDDIEGSVKLKKYVEKLGIDIEVVLAAEYKTEFGDLIAVGIHKQVINMQIDSFFDEVRSQGGIILLPHPYVEHKNVEELAARSDLIEVFNSRVDDKKNQAAFRLAKKLKKPFYFSSDAHFAADFNNCIIEFSRNGNLINSLLNSEIFQVTSIKTRFINIIFSQIIKSIKKTDLKLLLRNFLILFFKFFSLRKFV
jgi:predicted metal-dependent phosphoesterase TrpH